MADYPDELEPLFDYTRVQPNNVVSLDDDSVEEVPAFLKKRKRCISKVEIGDKNGKGVAVVNCDDDEEDWLPPPPKISETLVAEENSAIKDLRLKKQELAAFAQSAQDMLFAVEETFSVEDTVKKDLSGSLESAEETVPVQPPKPSCERTKIVISIQGRDEIKQLRVYKDDKFERVFKLYADKLKLDLEKLVFSFDGDKVSPSATPDSLDMEDEDIIEVHSKLLHAC